MEQRIWPTSPSMRSISTRARSWRRKSPRPTRATRRPCPALWRWRKQISTSSGRHRPLRTIRPSAWPTRDTTRAVLKDLDGGPWKTRIAEPQRRSVSRWHGDADARRAVYNNRTRLRSEVGQQAMRNRAELVERSFAHILDRGGMRRTWLRGRENVHKRYLIHVAGHNLGLLMRLLIGAGTPKEAVAGGWCFFVLLPTSKGAYEALITVLVAHSAMPALIVVNMRFDRRSD